MEIHKATCLVGILCLLICCRPKSEDVDVAAFSLEKILTIDTENDETAEMGLTDISHFDVDSEGKIFIFNRRGQENCIFILNSDGSLVSAFGKRGQGPGELQNPRILVISAQDETVVTDSEKVVVFNNAGELIDEFRKDTDFQHIIPLCKDRYLAIAVKLNQDLSQSFQVILCSSELEELKILESSKIASFQMADKVNIIPTLVHWETSGQYIYTGNTDEYEIRVFDYEGEQIRKISKEHDPISLSAEDREEYEQRIENYPPDLKDKFFIPESFPPFRDIVASGDEMLFVRTYEKSNAESSLYDIFNPEGEFMGRTEFEGYQVKLKGENVYCLKQKDSGYIELVVYKKIWD